MIAQSNASNTSHLKNSTFDYIFNTWIILFIHSTLNSFNFTFQFFSAQKVSKYRKKATKYFPEVKYNKKYKSPALRPFKDFIWETSKAGFSVF